MCDSIPCYKSEEVEEIPEERMYITTCQSMGEYRTNTENEYKHGKKDNFKAEVPPPNNAPKLEGHYNQARVLDYPLPIKEEML